MNSIKFWALSVFLRSRECPGFFVYISLCPFPVNKFCLFGVEFVQTKIQQKFWELSAQFLHKRLATLAEFIYPETDSGRFLGK